MLADLGVEPRQRGVVFVAALHSLGAALENGIAPACDTRCRDLALGRKSLLRAARLASGSFVVSSLRLTGLVLPLVRHLGTSPEGVLSPNLVSRGTLHQPT